MNNKLIVSLFDYSTQWPQPFIKAGYPVLCWDYKIEGDILDGFSKLQIDIDEAIENGYELYGCLFAPPCTHFTVSGAQYWDAKDKAAPLLGDVWNDVDYHIAYVDICLHLVDIYKPTFWALENPVGRIEKICPELKPFRKLLFNPCDYGDPWNKKTILWGEFNSDLPKNPVTPEYIIWGGSKYPKIWAGTGGKSEKTKTKRSQTPAGFANAFFLANQFVFPSQQLSFL